MFWRVAWKSLQQRKGSVFLTIAALTLSIMVLVGIEYLRQNARMGFSRTVSGVDLIVGARTGDINLLLYSVFRLGNASNNIRWSSYEEWAKSPDVAWTIPLSLGDSHKGYKVLGTNEAYFSHYRYGQNTPLQFQQGHAFAEPFEVVLGSSVARQLGYALGDQLILAHGTGSVSFQHHDAHPFRVTGILEATGTPVDQTLHVSLQGLEAIHLEGRSSVDASELKPKSITAFMVGLKSRVKVFHVQRAVNQYRGEPLQAILPGVTLTQLWSTLSIMENTLRVISWLVLVAALAGMAAMLMASLRERTREIALMRTLGAHPLFVAGLLQMEVLLMIVLSSLLAIGLLGGLLAVGHNFLLTQFGLPISFQGFSSFTTRLIEPFLIVVIAAAIVGLLPALSAYQISRRSSQISL